ncbi:hypothetical protein HanRHA438_Chr08g0334931 [Helianthus annuus]|nr:hypothetical protein HanIR_Chr08g0349581 [Helianthus annuus]KAJ0896460.1 hypothetical protein HanRHA438_Chr08g0334931 [Helianthus annuus]
MFVVELLRIDLCFNPGPNVIYPPNYNRVISMSIPVCVALFKSNKLFLDPAPAVLAPTVPHFAPLDHVITYIKIKDDLGGNWGDKMCGSDHMGILSRNCKARYIGRDLLSYISAISDDQKQYLIAFVRTSELHSRVLKMEIGLCVTVHNVFFKDYDKSDEWQACKQIFIKLWKQR